METVDVAKRNSSGKGTDWPLPVSRILIVFMAVSWGLVPTPSILTRSPIPGDGKQRRGSSYLRKGDLAEPPDRPSAWRNFNLRRRKPRFRQKLGDTPPGLTAGGEAGFTNHDTIGRSFCYARRAILPNIPHRQKSRSGVPVKPARSSR